MKVILEGNRIISVDAFHKFIKDLLQLPAYYGQNLDALWDCLTGWIETPLTIVWKDFHESKKHLGQLADDILSMLKMRRLRFRVSK